MSKTTWTENEERYRADFDRALVARDRGERRTAIDILLSVCRNLQSGDRRLATHSHLQLSNLLNHESDPEGRLRHAAIAASISPRYELASLVLFHALLAVGRSEDAMREMVRYVSLKDSPMYREVLGVGYSLELPMPELELAVQARTLLRDRENDASAEETPEPEKPEPEKPAPG